jgi:hypothetical protein
LKIDQKKTPKSAQITINSRVESGFSLAVQLKYVEQPVSWLTEPENESKTESFILPLLNARLVELLSRNFVVFMM